MIFAMIGLRRHDPRRYARQGDLRQCGDCIRVIQLYLREETVSGKYNPIQYSTRDLLHEEILEYYIIAVAEGTTY
jgi:hypothetical protein